ncbi:hypothetical protein BH09SUM1_BH09SUM1_03920 [soil metagenome]
MRKGILFALGILAASRAGGAPVTIQITQETTFGTSVFVSSELPLMGAGEIRKAVKLSPHAYPEWSAEFDLPPGITIHPKFYLRTDSPGTLTDGSNGTLITGAPDTIVVPGTISGEKIVNLYGGSAASRLRVTSSAPGFAPVLLNPEGPIDDGAGTQVMRFTIPADHVAMGRNYMVLPDGSTSAFAGADIALTGATTWYRNGQAFAYLPAAAAPSAKRIETFQFTPANFKPRTIRVMLPRGYDENAAEHYPVLYAQDGQNVFSPGGSFGSWDLDIIITNLIAHGEIPEIIVVGIDNTSDRLPEYIPNYTSYNGTQGRGDEYLTMMRDELMPAVNARYRTATGPENTAEVGSSLGGLLGYEAANEFEATFGGVIAMSSSFQLGTDHALAAAATGPETRARLWMDSGCAGPSTDNCTLIYQVRDALIASHNLIGDAFFHRYGYFQTGAAVEQGHQHNEAAWKDRSPGALRWLYAPMMKSPAPAAGPTGFSVSKASGEQRVVVVAK